VVACSLPSPRLFNVAPQGLDTDGLLGPLLRPKAIPPPSPHPPTHADTPRHTHPMPKAMYWDPVTGC